MARTFIGWLETCLGAPVDDASRLTSALEISVCRIEEAVRQGAKDPIHVLSNGAAPGSRAAMKSMLGKLGYTPAQVRTLQRLLGGSSGGWPGLLRLYTDEAALTPAQRGYLRRQFRDLRAHDRGGATCDA